MVFKDETYPINTSFKIALKCFELSESEHVSGQERTLGILVMLFGKEAILNADGELLKYLTEKAVVYLQCGVESNKQSTRVKDIDIVKDISYISTSIHTQYHIDLSTSDIHFWKFVELIEGLHGTLIDRIRDIRNFDLSAVDDLKERRKITDLKNQFSLNGNKIEKPKSLKELYDEIERG